MIRQRKRSECMACSYAEYKDELRVFCSFCMKNVMETKKPDASEIDMRMGSTAGQIGSAERLEA